MTHGSTTSPGLVRLGALLSDTTRAEILCALMDGRARTGSELSRHVGVAASTTSQHLAKLLDANIVTVEAQGRHRYWRLSDRRTAELLEQLGAHTTLPTDPKAPAALAYARTCYDHLAGTLAVKIYQQLIIDGLLHIANDVATITPTGYDRLRACGVDIERIRRGSRTPARSCLDWTERRHHLAGAAGAALYTAFVDNGWVRPGAHPRTVTVTDAGRSAIPAGLGIQQL